MREPGKMSVFVASIQSSTLSSGSIHVDCWLRHHELCSLLLTQRVDILPSTSYRITSGCIIPSCDPICVPVNSIRSRSHSIHSGKASNRTTNDPCPSERTHLGI